MSDSGAPKKAVTKKKLVDLKAVAALLEDGEGELEAPHEETLTNIDNSNADRINDDLNEELLQTTSRIKKQRDLIVLRLKKMDRHKAKVSSNVYEKVKRDYLIQLENISKLLNEKKKALKSALDKLYEERITVTDEINRHKEILEEAQFRHFLEEFSEEQFKEVEEYESREIQNLQDQLAQISGFIKVHEELFDPNELTAKAQQILSSTQETVIKETTSQERIVADSVRDKFESSPSLEEQEVQTQDEDPQEFSDLTPESKLAPQTEDYFESEESDGLDDIFEDAIENSPSLLDEESPIEQTPSEELKTKAPQEEVSSFNQPVSEQTGKTIIKKDPTGAAFEDEPEDIFDVLDDIPYEAPAGENIPLEETYEPSKTASNISQETAYLEPEKEESVSVSTSTSTSTSTSDKALAPDATGDVETSTHRLIFLETEGDVTMADFNLKENTSIGRSPSNDLVLKTPKVSRQHAAINKYKDQYIIIDLKSSNGLFINGQKVDEHILQAGDEISIAGYKMKFTEND